MRRAASFYAVTLILVVAAALPGAVSARDEVQAVHIVSHGWHTAIVFPRDALLDVVPELRGRFPSGRYLEVGWGDKGFYQAREISLGLIMKALFWPTESVVHVVAVPGAAHEAFPESEIRKLCLRKKQFGAVAVFIAESFRKETNGQVVRLQKGIYGNSQFYAGRGSYFLFNTCNKWTAKGLKRAGYDIYPAFKLSAASIINYIDSNSLKALAGSEADVRAQC